MRQAKNCHRKKIKKATFRRKLLHNRGLSRNAAIIIIIIIMSETTPVPGRASIPHQNGTHNSIVAANPQSV